MHAEIGVIGGSGFYSFLDDVEEVEVSTPYGPPSDPVAIGTLPEGHRGAGRRVAFLPRHGHRPPLSAPQDPLPRQPLGAALARRAPGGRAERRRVPDARRYGPGTLTIPDQVVDRTSGRAQTYYDDGAVHVSFSDPYCPVGRRTTLETARGAGWSPVDGGTLVVIEGPRFSSRAESQLVRRAGVDAGRHDRPPGGGAGP